MKTKTYLSSNASQTRSLGRLLSSEILHRRKLEEKAIILALRGELGAGKTTFLQGLSRGLGIKNRILSPTFVIMKRFKISIAKKRIKNLEAINFKNFYHIDCYRIQNPKEILGLGFNEIIENPYNIIAIEWADKIQKIIPKGSFWIDLRFVDKNKRKITMHR